MTIIRKRNIAASSKISLSPRLFLAISACLLAAANLVCFFELHATDRFLLEGKGNKTATLVLSPLERRLESFAVPETTIVKQPKQAAVDPTTTQQQATSKHTSSVDEHDQSEPRPRKFLLLHLGPSKTGTTSIQKDSGLEPGFQAALRADNTIYVGKFSSTPRNTTRRFHDIMSCAKAEYQRSVGKSVSSDSYSDGCWNDLMQRPIYQQLLSGSLVFSDEKMSYTGFELEDSVRALHQNLVVGPQQQSGQPPAFRPFDEIIVVAAYRRYAEWLLSAYKEQNLKHCLIRHRNDNFQALTKTQQQKFKSGQWPIKFEEGMRDKDKLGGSKCPNVWKDFLTTYLDGPQHNTRFYRNVDQTIPMLQSIQEEIYNARATKSSTPAFHVHILDFHSKAYNSITTTLYCQILNATADGTYLQASRAPNTCKYSMHRPEAPIHHQGSVAPTAYDDIVVAAAVDYGLIDTATTTRFEARIALENHHTQVLNKSFVDLPLICPSREDLQRLLSKSLNFEAKVMGQDYALAHREEHEAKFWKSALEKNEYCWVDTERLLVGATSWQQVLDERLTQSW